MGTFSERAIIDYRLPFANKGNNVCFPFAANKQKFAISIFRLQKTTAFC
jgi:hypothetical protein